jgi:hypothetical protein
VKDDSVKSSRRCCALMIGLVEMLERRLDHSQPHDQCPSATSSIYSVARRGLTTIDRLTPPDQGVRLNENGDSVPFRWAPVRVNPTFSLLTST